MTGSFAWKRIGWIAAAIVILGAVIGVGAGLLSLALSGVEYVAMGYREGVTMPGPFGVPAWRRVASVVVVSLIAAVIWWLLRTKTTKVPSVGQAVNGRRMPAWQTVVHVLLQIVIVGAGSSIGREVAPRELGAMLGQRFSDVTHIVNERDRRMLVAVAAGAGLAGVYDAPFAGMFFAVEILLADTAIETVGLALGTSAVAAFVASVIKGRAVFYDISAMQAAVTPSLMAFALFGGIVFGLVGALFRRCTQWAESNRPTGATVLWMMPAAAVLTGIVAIWVPQVMGNGRAAAQLAFNTTSAGNPTTLLPLLAVTFASKAVVTLLTIRSGASGGVLQPGVALGASFGAMLGLLWVWIFPGDSVAACALIGAAALLGAAQQAPLMAMCLVMELTRAPISFFVPVGIAVAVSALVSSQFFGPVSRSQRKPGGQSLEGGNLLQVPNTE